jgi:hypothetical protein
MKNTIKILALVLGIGAISQTVRSYGGEVNCSPELIENWREMRMSVTALLQNERLKRRIEILKYEGDPEGEELERTLGQLEILMRAGDRAEPGI